MWRWVYGMLATFGLRPRELFVEPDINWWLSSQNIDHTWKVNKNTLNLSGKPVSNYHFLIDNYYPRNWV
jgi:hypothetical protein